MREIDLRARHDADKCFTANILSRTKGVTRATGFGR